MVTIYDVAARSGVSAATVSRVFNGVNVRRGTREAVLEAAEELGFVPNRQARALRTRSSGLIAMMVPDIENPFFTTMTRAVEDVARAEGFAIMLCNTDDDSDREDSYLRAMVGEQVAGIISVPASPASSYDIAVERGVPVVCVDRTAPGLTVDSVVADNRAAAAHATSLLQAQGHRVVA